MKKAMISPVGYTRIDLRVTLTRALVGRQRLLRVAVMRTAEKKRDAPGCVPLLSSLSAEVGELVARGCLVGLDLHLLGEAFVVFAQDSDNFIAAEVVG